MMNSIEVENLLLSDVYSSMDFHGVYHAIDYREQ